MRLLTALAVIYGHASAVTGRGPGDIFLQYVGYKFIGGVAVDVFFVLSGFLITASVMSGNGIRYFIASRVLRIYPALIVCCVLSVFLLGSLLTISDQYWQSMDTWRYLLGNATAYRTEYFLPGVFSELHDHAINGSLWSLQIEVRLYLMIGIGFLIGVFSSKRVFNALFFTVIILGYFAPDMFSRLFEPENHRHVAMMFMIGSFAWVNRESIPMRPDVMFALLVFADVVACGIEQAVAVLGEHRVVPDLVVDRKPNEPAEQQVVVELLDQHPLGSNPVDRLQQQGQQKLLWRN